MRSNTWRAILLLSLTLVLVSTAMDAQAARRSSLAGNQFINDADDMFAFPQLIMKYKNRVIVDMEPGDGEDGNGSVVFGDNMVWNFNTGRSDFLNNTASWAWGGADRYPMGLANGIPGTGGSNGNAIEWWDLGMATHLGETPFGFNISWATDKNEINPPTGDPTQDNSTNMLSFQLGATFGTVDLAGEVGFGSYKDELVGLDPSDQNDYSFFNFALLARGDLEDVGGLDWRWIAAFASGSTEPKMTDAVKLSSSGFRGSFGPVWGTPGEWEVAAYMNFDYVTDDYDKFPGDKKDTDKYMSFPGYNMAMEYYLNSWLVARGGIMSHNATDTYTEETPTPGTGETEYKDRHYDFFWTLGFGVDKGNWGLDLALDEEDVHSGYLPLNGSVSNEPIAYLTAWLAW
jgi:hypothetical protein